MWLGHLVGIEKLQETTVFSYEMQGFLPVFHGSAALNNHTALEYHLFLWGSHWIERVHKFLGDGMKIYESHLNAQTCLVSSWPSSAIDFYRFFICAPGVLKHGLKEKPTIGFDDLPASQHNKLMIKWPIDCHSNHRLPQKQCRIGMSGQRWLLSKWPKWCTPALVDHWRAEAFDHAIL